MSEYRSAIRSHNAAAMANCLAPPWHRLVGPSIRPLYANAFPIPSPSSSFKGTNSRWARRRQSSANAISGGALVLGPYGAAVRCHNAVTMVLCPWQNFWCGFHKTTRYQSVTDSKSNELLPRNHTPLGMRAPIISPFSRLTLPANSR